MDLSKACDNGKVKQRRRRGLPALFIEWVYIDAPRIFIETFRQFIISLNRYFSINLLITTLFDPWRHDATDISRLPIRYWAQAIISNGVSRLIGFTVRFFVILIGVIGIGLTGIAGGLFLLAWYILPVLMVVSVVFGFYLISGGFNG